MFLCPSVLVSLHIILFRSQMPFGNFQEIDLPSSSSAFVIEGLRPGLQYEAELSAENSVGKVAKKIVFATQPTGRSRKGKEKRKVEIEDEAEEG